MALRQFTVNVPNPSSAARVASLRLEPVNEAQMTAFGYDLPAERLAIRAARLTIRPSAMTVAGCFSVLWDRIVAIIRWLFRRPIGPRRRALEVRLDPRSSADVRVSIDVVGATGASAMQLVDRRDGKIVGGVTLLIINGAVGSPSGPIPARNPCPIDLAEDPFWLPVGAEVESPRYGGPIPAGYEVDFVAWITNPTKEILNGATGYLEHLGGADAEFRPSTWNLGNLEPGDRFPLRWRISPRAGIRGRWSGSIVVEAEGFDPFRLRPTIEIGGLGPIEIVDGDGVPTGPD